SPYSDRYETGRSLFLQKLFHYNGVDATTGLYRFEDADRNGYVEYPADLVGRIEEAQQCYGGVSTTLTYKSLSLSIFVHLVNQSGRDYISDQFWWPGSFGNQPVYILGAWSRPGDVSRIQRFSQDYQSAASHAFYLKQQSDAILTDASFI